MTIRPKVSFVFLIFYFPLLLFSFAVVLSIEKGVFLFFSTHVDFYVVQMSAWCEGRACLDQWYYSGHRISFSIRRWMPSMRRELNDHVLWLWAFQFDTALKIDIFVWGRKSNDNLSKKKEVERARCWFFIFSFQFNKYIIEGLAMISYFSWQMPACYHSANSNI